jgi:hypothetical protein
MNKNKHGFAELGRSAATEAELRGTRCREQLVAKRPLLGEEERAGEKSADGSTSNISWVTFPADETDEPEDDAQSRDRVWKKLPGLEGLHRLWRAYLPDPARTPMYMAEVETSDSPIRAPWARSEIGLEATFGEQGPFENGTVLHLPIEDIHYSHDSQTEWFTGGDGTHNLLETFLELWSGKKREEDLPMFSVVWHDRRWHVRTGNRRLMVWQLLRIHAPERFKKVKVTVADVDNNFLKWHTSHVGRWVRPKLTTGKNGPDCKGTWTKVKETGEYIGQEEATFAADLLSLICAPCNELIAN